MRIIILHFRIHTYIWRIIFDNLSFITSTVQRRVSPIFGRGSFIKNNSAPLKLYSRKPYHLSKTSYMRYKCINGAKLNRILFYFHFRKVYACSHIAAPLFAIDDYISKGPYRSTRGQGFYRKTVSVEKTNSKKGRT